PQFPAAIREPRRRRGETRRERDEPVANTPPCSAQRPPDPVEASHPAGSREHEACHALCAHTPPRGRRTRAASARTARDRTETARIEEVTPVEAPSDDLCGHAGRPHREMTPEDEHPAEREGRGGEVGR